MKPSLHNTSAPRGLMDLSDEGLLAKARNGHQEAFEALYKRYTRGLYQYGHHLVRDKELVEDAVHDVFISLLTAKKLGKVLSLKAYLLASLRNRLLSQIKKIKTYEAVDPCSLEGISQQAEPCIADLLINAELENEQAGKVRLMVGQLTERQREVVYLRFYQGLSYPEIAVLMNADQRNVYNLASKAFSSLREKLSLVK